MCIFDSEKIKDLDLNLYIQIYVLRFEDYYALIGVVIYVCIGE